LFNDHLISKILVGCHITYKMQSSNDIFEIYWSLDDIFCVWQSLNNIAIATLNEVSMRLLTNYMQLEFWDFLVNNDQMRKVIQSSFKLNFKKSQTCSFNEIFKIDLIS